MPLNDIIPIIQLRTVNQLYNKLVYMYMISDNVILNSELKYLIITQNTHLSRYNEQISPAKVVTINKGPSPHSNTPSNQELALLTHNPQLELLN